MARPLRFVAILKDVVCRFNRLCHTYCLMDKHYHLMIETPDGNLSQSMRQLNGVYIQLFNQRRCLFLREEQMILGEGEELLIAVPTSPAWYPEQHQQIP
jgi:hypothetical protein